jgi:hypothetical protein
MIMYEERKEKKGRRNTQPVEQGVITDITPRRQVSLDAKDSFTALIQSGNSIVYDGLTDPRIK